MAPYGVNAALDVGLPEDEGTALGGRDLGTQILKLQHLPSWNLIGGLVWRCSQPAVVHRGAAPAVLRRPLLAEALSALQQRAQLQHQHVSHQFLRRALTRNLGFLGEH